MHSLFFVGQRLVRRPTGEITWYGKAVPNGRWLQRLIVGVALSGIQRIQPLIHRIEFTGNFEYENIENAVDIYCTNSEAVSDLFYLMRRYLYVPFSKETSMDGGTNSMVFLSQGIPTPYITLNFPVAGSLKRMKGDPTDLLEETPMANQFGVIVRLIEFALNQPLEGGVV